MSKVLLVSSILIPLIGSVTVFSWGHKNKKTVSTVSAIFSGATLAVIITLYVLFSNGQTLRAGIDVGLPFDLALRADALGLFLCLVSASIWFLVDIFNIEFIQERKGLFAFFLQLSLYGMLGIALSENLFTLFIFFEVFSIASAVLVMHDLSGKAIRASFQYLFISIVGTACLIVGSAITFGLTGSLDLLGTGIRNLSANGVGILAFWLMILGFAVKAGLFPVHIVLPQAYPVAPSSAVALLSGVMTKAGAYGIIRIIYGVYGSASTANNATGGILLGIAVFTLLIGSIVAVSQTNIKRMLAYSSVAQIGYVILGVALLSPKGLAGAGLQILNHAVGKSALFLVTGAFIYKTGIVDIKKLAGIGKRMPLAMTVFTFAAFSIIGVPPFLGFFSKWFLAVGSIEAYKSGFISLGINYIIIGSLIASTILNLLYFMPIVVRGWFRVPEGKLAVIAGGSHEEHEEPKFPLDEAPLKMGVPMVILGLATLFLGIYVSLPLKLISNFVTYYF